MTTTDYLCGGHPAWPYPLVITSRERAMAWYDEHVGRHPGIWVQERTTTRTTLAGA